MARRTVFDDVFRTICEKMPSLLVPFVNEVFGTTYTGDVEVIPIRNERFTLNKELITDAVVKIDEHLYHIECQSKEDGSMSIRMLEYDFVIAYDNMRKTGEPYRLEFPESCVIYLRKGTGKTGTRPVEVVFPTGEKVNYSMKVINIQDYSMDEIFQKNLLMFLPFYILRYEEEMSKGVKKNREKLDMLVGEISMLCERLTKSLEDGDARDIYFADLIHLIRRISDHVAKPKSIKERLGDAIMGGKVLTLWSEELKAEGMAEGRAEGSRITIYEMVQDGDTTPEKGANRLGITVAELKAGMHSAGYRFPR